MWLPFPCTFLVKAHKSGYANEISFVSLAQLLMGKITNDQNCDMKCSKHYDGSCIMKPHRCDLKLEAFATNMFFPKTLSNLKHLLSVSYYVCFANYILRNYHNINAQ